MRRTPVRPSLKPIKRRTPLTRSTKRIPSRRRDPKRRTWASHRCEPFRAWLKQQACCVTHCWTGQPCYDVARPGAKPTTIWVVVDPAHLIPRGRGSDDLYNCVPLARHLHEEQEKRTDAFNAKYGVNLWELAKEYTERWLATDEGMQWQDSPSEVT